MRHKSVKRKARQIADTSGLPYNEAKRVAIGDVRRPECPQEPPRRLLAAHPLGAWVATSVDGELGFSHTDEATAPSLDAHEDAITALCVSGDGRWLVSACEDKSIRVWDCNTWARVTRFTSSKKISAVCFTPDSSYAVLGDKFGEVFALRMEAGAEPTPLMGHYCSIITCLAVDSSGRFLASGDRDGKLRISHLPDHLPAGAWHIAAYCLGHSGAVTAATFMQPSQRSAVSQQDTPGQPLDSLRAPGENAADGSADAAAAPSSVAREDGVARGGLEAQQDGLHTDNVPASGNTCREGKEIGQTGACVADVLVSGALDGKLIAWDFETGAMLSELAPETLTGTGIGSDEARKQPDAASAACEPDGGATEHPAVVAIAAVCQGCIAVAVERSDAIAIVSVSTASSQHHPVSHSDTTGPQTHASSAPGTAAAAQSDRTGRCVGRGGGGGNSCASDCVTDTGAAPQAAASQLAAPRSGDAGSTDSRKPAAAGLGENGASVSDAGTLGHPETGTLRQGDAAMGSPAGVSCAAVVGQGSQREAQRLSFHVLQRIRVDGLKLPMAVTSCAIKGQGSGLQGPASAAGGGRRQLWVVGGPCVTESKVLQVACLDVSDDKVVSTKLLDGPSSAQHEDSEVPEGDPKHSGSQIRPELRKVEYPIEVREMRKQGRRDRKSKGQKEAADEEDVGCDSVPAGDACSGYDGGHKDEVDE